MTIILRRELGRTGLRPTILGLGGAPLGDLFECLPEEQADDVVRAAISAGITFFDTAPFYGHGLSEHRIGRGIRQVERQRVIISTKVGRVYRRPNDLATYSTGTWAGGLHFEPQFSFSADGILRSYEDSLLRLGLNRVDCLVIHDLENRLMPDSELHRHRGDFEASGWPALRALRSSGEIRAIGAGINDVSMMKYFLERFDFDFFLLATPYTLLDQASLPELDECLKRGISIVKGSPYASGILATGPVPGAVYDYAPATLPVMEKTRQIMAVCAECGVTLQAASLQFPLGHPAVTAVIPGATSPEIIAKNLTNLIARIPAPFWVTLKAKGLLSHDAPVPDGQ